MSSWWICYFLLVLGGFFFQTKKDQIAVSFHTEFVFLSLCVHYDSTTQLSLLLTLSSFPLHLSENPLTNQDDFLSLQSHTRLILVDLGRASCVMLLCMHYHIIFANLVIRCSRVIHYKKKHQPLTLVVTVTFRDKWQPWHGKSPHSTTTTLFC